MRVLIFGASGYLGAEVAKHLKNAGWHLTLAGRSNDGLVDVDTAATSWAKELQGLGAFDGVLWAQGKNSSGTVLTTAAGELLESFDANVAYIARTLKDLAEENLLNNPCRGVVLSSIWQETTRPSKFAYSVTKAALSGLTSSIAIDMAPRGFSINAVLPGVIDSPMTRANLSSKAIEKFSSETPGGSLATASEVASTVAFLLSPGSSGINSQSIVLDKGWSKARYVAD